jgi:hypothetical protein
LEYPSFYVLDVEKLGMFTKRLKMANNTMEKEIIHKELDLIQDVIKRMASNSFEVKKWLIGILSAIVVFSRDELLGGNIQLIGL